MTYPIHTDLEGKVALVTGGTAGIGKEIARGLAARGATVIIGARDTSRGADAVRDITDVGGHMRVSAMHLDVSDQESIRRFAEDFRRQHRTLHLLVNNAGAWFTDRRTSADGHELTFATNVLGPFLLTEELAPILVRRARVVNVVSGLAGSYDADDLEYERRPYNGFKAYAQSKQALRMLTWGFAARMASRGISVNAAAPGFVHTDLNRHARGVMAAMIRAWSRLLAVPAAKGAETPLWAATAPELEGTTARYLSGRRERDSKFRDASAVADLEYRCRAMTGAFFAPRSVVRPPFPALHAVAGGAR